MNAMNEFAHRGIAAANVPGKFLRANFGVKDGYISVGRIRNSCKGGGGTLSFVDFCFECNSFQMPKGSLRELMFPYPYKPAKIEDKDFPVFRVGVLNPLD